jgi:hypothetical protein
MYVCVFDLVREEKTIDLSGAEFLKLTPWLNSL